MADKNHHLIANLTGTDIFVVARADADDRGCTVLTFLLKSPGRVRGFVHRIAPRHFVGIPFEGPQLRYRLENKAGVVLNPGNMPDGRPCWAVTGFKN